MKRINQAVLAIVLLLCSVQLAAAAGSWTTYPNRTGALGHASNYPEGVARLFTADAADASIPVLTVPQLAGQLQAIDVEFSAITAPDSVTVTVKTAAGITIATNAAPLTASGRITLTTPVPIVGDITLTITGNTTNSAIATVVLYVF